VKVCLINPPDPVVEDARWDEPLGLLYLGAVLEENGVEVEVVDLNFHDDFQVLEGVDADYFGLYCSSSLLKSTLKVNQYIKDTHPNSKRLVGGPHATCAPNDFVEHFDKIVVGEGERAILSALQGGSPKILSKIPIQNLDQIPYPARHLVPIKEYHRRVNGRHSTGIITARGCPFSCAFCSKVWGTGVRFRSAENILGEVEKCLTEHDISAFSIRDDTFTLNRKRLMDTLNGFKKLDIVWRCLTRVDQVDKENLTAMKDAGCTQIVYGLESGNQQILNNLRKGTTVKQNIEAVRLTMEAGIETKTAVIVGNPGETWETVQDTINMVEEIMPDEVILCIFTPYPGSPVWDNPEAFGIKILTRDVTKYAAVGPDMTGNVVIETEKMSAQDITDAHRMALRRFRELGLVP